MTKKKVKSQPEEEVLPVVAEKKTPAKRKHVKKVVEFKPVVVPKTGRNPKPDLDPSNDMGLAVDFKSAPIPKAPEMDVNSVKVIQDKVRIIRAKMESSDPTDQEEGKKELQDLTDRMKSNAENAGEELLKRFNA